MTSYWKRSMALALGAGVIALTAACGAEVGATAQSGIPAGAGAAPATTSPGGGDPSLEPSAPGPSDAAPTSPEASADGGSTDSEPGGEPAGPQAAPATTPESPTSPEPSVASTSPAQTTSAGASDEDFAFMEDYCSLMPKSYVTDLEKDASRDKTSTCTYKSPDSVKDLRIVTVTGGFDTSYEGLDESYNVDLERVDIDGRDGFTWHNSTDSLYSALFNLPAPEGRKMSMMVIITDDGQSLAEKKKEAIALAAEISKEVPR